MVSLGKGGREARLRPGTGPEGGPVGDHLAIEEGDGPKAAEEDGQKREAVHRVASRKKRGERASRTRLVLWELHHGGRTT